MEGQRLDTISSRRVWISATVDMYTSLIIAYFSAFISLDLACSRGASEQDP